jgi:hypothetical protein
MNPELVGATAARGLSERNLAVAKVQGQGDSRLLVAIHQLYLLRRSETYHRYLERPARLLEPCLPRLHFLSETLRGHSGTAPPVAC